MNPTNATPYKLSPEQVAQLLAEKSPLTRTGATREPSPYAKDLMETPIGGAFSICSAAQADDKINNAKQNVRNALKRLVDTKAVSPRHLKFFFIRPDGTPQGELVMALVAEGEGAKRAPRKAKEEPAAPVAESAPA